MKLLNHIIHILLIHKTCHPILPKKEPLAKKYVVQLTSPYSTLVWTQTPTIQNFAGYFTLVSSLLSVCQTSVSSLGTITMHALHVQLQSSSFKVHGTKAWLQTEEEASVWRKDQISLSYMAAAVYTFQ